MTTKMFFLAALALGAVLTPATAEDADNAGAPVNVYRRSVEPGRAMDHRTMTPQSRPMIVEGRQSAPLSAWSTTTEAEQAVIDRNDHGGDSN